jgi:hypothetical protein
MKRYAIVGNARTRSEAEAYLPSNYRVIFETTDPSHNDRPVFVIEGEDDSGWTLDNYVIPRYGSGLIACQEIDLSHPIIKVVPVS